MKQNIGKQLGGKDTVVDQGPTSGHNIDLTFQKKKKIDDAVKQRIERMSPGLRSAFDNKRIREKSSLVLDEYIRQEITNQEQRKADAWEENEKRKYVQQSRATIIDIGREDGYFNKNIHKALLIAKKGKEMGATHFSIG